MPLPYKIASLLYAFHEDGRVLMMERQHDPNRGLFSPPGGKLQTDTGESPHNCAIREANEETGLNLAKRSTPYRYSQRKRLPRRNSLAHVSLRD